MFKLIKILFGINRFNLIGWILAMIVVAFGSALIVISAFILAAKETLPIVFVLGAIWMVLMGLFSVFAQKLIIMFIKEIEEKSQSSRKPDKPDNKESVL